MQSKPIKKPKEQVLEVHNSNISLDELFNHFKKRSLGHGKERS